MHAFSAAKRVILVCLCLTMIAAAARAADSKPGYLGVMLQDVTPTMAKALQLGDKAGVIILEVVKDSPAAKVGLEDGDVILEFDGKPVGDYKTLTADVGKAGAGRTVEMVILHNGKQQKLKVELGERDEKAAWTAAPEAKVFKFEGPEGKEFHLQMLKEMQENMPGEHEVIIRKFQGGDDADVFVMKTDRGFMGVHLDDVEGQLAEYFGLKDGKGSLITSVNEDSPAAKAGLKAGDVIVKVGDQAVASAADVHEALSGTEPGQEVAVKVVRKGSDKTLKVTLGDAPEDAQMRTLKIIHEGDDVTTIRAPRMMFHGQGMPKHLEQEFEWTTPDKEAMAELRAELDALKKELQHLKQELKK